MLRELVLMPDERLNTICSEVEDVNGEVRQELDDMMETMKKSLGIGLAGPQVGIMKRLIVIGVPKIELPESKKKELGKESLLPEIPGYPAFNESLFIVNPTNIEVSGEDCVFQEGCLSVPEQGVNIIRKSCVEFDYVDYNGEKKHLKASGLLARCFLHELDHVNGITIIDHLSGSKKQDAIKVALSVKQRKAANKESSA